MSLVSVEGFSGLKKDTASGGVINTDRNSYQNYKTSKSIALKNIQQQKNSQEHIEHLQCEIDSIKCDLGDIRMMLVQLLQKGN